jgi:hypothetical protein
VRPPPPALLLSFIAPFLLIKKTRRLKMLTPRHRQLGLLLYVYIYIERETYIYIYIYQLGLLLPVPLSLPSSALSPYLHRAHTRQGLHER